MTAKPEPAIAAHARALQAANPAVPWILIPAAGADGKVPDAGKDWQRRTTSVQFHRWHQATGWGAVLTRNDRALCVDIDRPDLVPADLAALLKITPGMTYKTRKGRHHWFLLPADHEPLRIDAPWGEAWYHQPRFVAMGGGANKSVPTTWHIPPAPPELVTLLSQSPTKTETGQNGGHGGYHPWALRTIGEMKAARSFTLNDVYDHIINHPIYADAERRHNQGNRPTHPLADLDRAIDNLWNEPEPAPPPQDEPPVSAYDKPSRPAAALPRILVGQTEIDDYANNLPELPHITPTGGGELVIGGADDYTFYLGDPGSGKTMALLYTIRTLNEPTLWIATESMEDVAVRMKQIGGFGQHIILAGHPAPEHIPHYTDLANEHGCRYVVIDTLAPLMEDEDRASAWAKIQRTYLPLTAGRSTILAHHFGKTDKSTGRGTYAFSGSAAFDYKITSKKLPDELVVTIAHLNKTRRAGRAPAGLRLHIPLDDISAWTTSAPAPGTEPGLTPDQWSQILATALSLMENPRRPDGTNYEPTIHGTAKAVVAHGHAPNITTAKNHIQNAVAFGTLSANENTGYNKRTGISIPPGQPDISYAPANGREW